MQVNSTAAVYRANSLEYTFQLFSQFGAVLCRLSNANLADILACALEIVRVNVKCKFLAEKVRVGKCVLEIQFFQRELWIAVSVSVVVNIFRQRISQPLFNVAVHKIKHISNIF